MKALYFKNLDTLRFFAFFLVFWQHGFSHSFDTITYIDKSYVEALTMTGGIGVHIFFVISGFLITFLLLKEFENAKTISVKNFYARRILRIWPVYYLVLGLGIFILPRLIHTFTFCGNTALNLLFLNNFDMNTTCFQPNIGIAWSVAIEEQFYLFWPLIFTLLIRKPAVLFATCFAIYMASSVYILLNPTLSYFHTFGNLNYLMTGCMGAMLFNKYAGVISNSFLMDKKSFVLVLVVLLVLTLFKWAGSIFIVPFMYLYIVIYLVSNNSDADKPSILSYFGKYTYGMYMYHPILIIATKMVFDHWALNYKQSGSMNFVVAIIALSLTIGFAIVSYEFFEKPFLNIKRKLSLIKTRI